MNVDSRRRWARQPVTTSAEKVVDALEKDFGAVTRHV